MIFAELDYEGEYGDAHKGLACLLSKHFSRVESGHQGDSWFWVLDGEEKVAVDTFTSMRHQVKSAKPGVHVKEVINVLLAEYKLNIYESPVLEEHEDD